MARKLTAKEIENRFAAINALEPEEPTAEDILAFEDDSDAITLEDFKATHEYSGRINLRMPKSLHERLAKEAKAEGMSLNYYMVYKLSSPPLLKKA